MKIYFIVQYLYGDGFTETRICESLGYFTKESDAIKKEHELNSNSSKWGCYDYIELECNGE